MSEIKTSHLESLQSLYVYRKENDIKDPDGTVGRIVRRSHSDNANYINGLTQEISLLGEQLKHQLKDGLTGVYNKAAFEEFFQKEIAESKREKKPFLLLFLDLDKFKLINDMLGHLAGDEALKVFGNLLTTSFREEDIISRYGGDEFTVIAKGAKSEVSEMENKCFKIENDYKKLLQEKFKGQENVFNNIGVSYGISIWKEGFDMNRMIAEADMDMYKRKKDKKNEQK